MKLLLLKTLLQRRARDEGFTLPMVIALGLVMLLLGAVSITTANEENLTAITQNSKSDALAIAEVGVARYRELLDRNRVLAVNDSSVWGTQTQICDNLTSFLPGVSKNISLDEDGQVLNNDGDSTDSFTIGSYSLVSYDYTNDNLPTAIANGTFNMTNDTANNNARGILTVKGTAPDDSEAQIQVEIPIRINLADMTNLAPALWIGDNTITVAELGNLTISDGDPLTTNDGNVVIQDLPVTSGTTRDGCRSFSSLASTTRPVISDSRSIPSIQKVIDDVTNAKTALGVSTVDPVNAVPSVTPATPATGTSPRIPARMVFGATTDKPYNPDSDTTNCPNIKLCRYYYDFGSTTSPLTSPLTDTDLLTDGVANTTLLLNQNLTINTTTDNVKIGSSGTISPSNAFEIYVNGNNNITINADTGRTVTINAFIHAPQSTLTITGDGTVNINGSVWVNDFVNTTATVNITPDTISRQPTPDNPATSGQGYEFYSTTANRTPRPLTGSPTNWKTEEVN